MPTMTEIQRWDDSKLVAELRNPARERFPVTYTVLMAEAVARMLEGRMVTADQQFIVQGAQNIVPEELAALVERAVKKAVG